MTALSQQRVSTSQLPPYNGLMITRMLVLATVLALILAVTTPVLADQQDKPPKPPPRIDMGTMQRIPGTDYWITDKGWLFSGRDVIVAKCGPTENFENEEDARACEKAGYSVKGSPTQHRVEPQTPLTNTGGLPVTLVPIALLVASGLLIRKSTAL